MSMSNYNNMERMLAKTLDAFPFVKKIARNSYQRLSYLLNKEKNFQYELHSKVNIQAVGSGTNESWFGYYDKSPWSTDMKYYAYHELEDSNKVNIKIWDVKKRKDFFSISSNAFNFQQGSMLHWFVNTHKIGFNDVRENKLVFVTYDLDTKLEKVIAYPVQTLRPQNDKYLSINYKRLDKLRAEYGYTANVDNFEFDMPYDQDGLWLVDIDSEKSELIISLNDLMNNHYHPTMNQSNHKVNHAMFSPNGEKFIFMHRWLGSNGKFSRLYVSDLKGKNLKILLDDRMVSHYHWYDDSNIVVWGRKESIGDRYFFINVDSGETKILGESEINQFGDGHPSFAPNKKWLITDTYPDKSRKRHLILYDYENNKHIKLGAFFAPWKYNDEVRCDLHPRWSPNGEFLSIDSAHEGIRKTYILDIQTLVLESK